MENGRKQSKSTDNTYSNVMVGRFGNINTSIKTTRRELVELNKYYKVVDNAIRRGEAVDRVGEWLWDNIDTIIDRILISKRLCNKKLKHLPMLSDGLQKGICRICSIAQAYIDHENGKISADSLIDYISALGSVDLTVEEAWTLKYAVELALIKGIVTITSRQYWLTKQSDTVQKALDILSKSNIDNVSKFVPLHNITLVGQIITSAQQNDGAILRRLDKILASQGSSCDSVLDYYQRMEYSVGITFSNLVASLLTLDGMDWEEIFCQTCSVDRILQLNTFGAYSKMDKESKTEYRKAISCLAKKRKISQRELATQLVEEANDAGEDVGFYIFDEKSKYIKRTVIFSVLTFAFALLFVLPWIAFADLGFIRPIIIFLSVIPSISIGEAITLKLFSRFIKPKQILKMDLSDGLDEDTSTAILIPALIVDDADAEKLIEQMEVNFLANKSEYLSVVLLGDLKSADCNVCIDDEHIKEAVLNGVRSLNEKYGNKFFYFQRHRTKDPDGKYCGFERKRGAVLAFNRFVTGGEKTAFSCVSDGAQSLIGVNYVVTLDVDTQTSINGAIELVGAAHHPLNRPKLDENGKITSGYGIIQPRMRCKAKCASKTAFSRLISKDNGSEPYVNTAFEEYQDIYGSSNFSGKGVYSPSVFAKVLDGRFMAGRILSHDLVEGELLRTGYASDIVFFDTQPSTYISYKKRNHRWLRGDWQHLQFLGQNIKNEQGERVKNPFSLLSKLKMLHNMRRSLYYPLSVLLILFTINSPFVFLYSALLLVGLELVHVVPQIWGDAKRLIMSFVPTGYKLWNINLLLLKLITAFDTALIHADATVRSIWRLITGKKLLEWQTAGQAECSSKGGVLAYYSSMFLSVVLGAFVFVLGVALGNVVAVVLGAVVIFAPLVVWFVGLECLKTVGKIPQECEDIANEAAKGAWRYYRELCTKENSFLPPDNFQELNSKGVAQRTSPTNIAMMLVGCVAAYRLGYAKLSESVDMISNATQSLAKLEKYNGHPYNWYSTADLRPLEPKFISSADNGNLACAIVTVIQALESYRKENITNELNEKLITCINGLKLVLDGIDMSFLYDGAKELLSVGYDCQRGELSPHCYDLLASEARQASFYGIISGKLPEKHWTRLSRPLYSSHGHLILKSWSGSMFEYLMPAIFMAGESDSLLECVYKGAIFEQMSYAKRKGVPWGISESGYSLTDDDGNYQYKAFGVPSLAVRRLRRDELVISPYACALALGVDGDKASKNLIEMKKNGLCGYYGFYEAQDNCDSEQVTVKSYMAHHQGMILLSATNYLCDGYIQKLFASSVEVMSGEYLLNEVIPEWVKPLRMPKLPAKTKPQIKHGYQLKQCILGMWEMPRLTTLNDGDYGALFSNSGSNYSYFGKMMLNKWRPDILNEKYGHFIFIKDINNGDTFSATCAPIYKGIKNARACFEPYKVTYENEYHGLSTKLEVTISGANRATVFLLTVKNTHNRKKRIMVADYMEAALESMEENLAHPQYSDMFTRLEFDEATFSTMAIRRARSAKSTERFLCVTSVSDKDSQKSIMTSKTDFIGRGRSLRYPRFCDADFAYGDTKNSGISGCISLAHGIELDVGGTAQIAYTVSYSDSMEECIQKMQRYSVLKNCIEEFDIQSARMVSVIKNNSVTAVEYSLANRLLSQIVYPTAYNGEYSVKHKKEELWKFGISGDDAIICLTANGGANSVSLALKLHRMISSKAIRCDLVIISWDNGYHGNNFDEISRIIDSSQSRGLKNKKGGVFLIRGEKATSADIRAIIDNACIRLYGKPSKINSLLETNDKPIKLAGIKRLNGIAEVKNTEITDIPEFFNGYGGFDDQNNEYKIFLRGRMQTPHPWSHILANEKFGTLVTQAGGGFTWYKNSRENKLTSWSNDPVSDTPSELLYVVDEGDSSIYTAEKIGKSYGDYNVTYGIGYAVYSHSENDIDIERTVLVPENDSVKLSLLSITNNTDNQKTVNVYYYVDCHLSSGISAFDEGIHHEEIKSENLLLAHNRAIPENGVMFISSSGVIKSVILGKQAFFGRMSEHTAPKALYSSNINSHGHDSMTICVTYKLKPHSQKKFTFVLGAADDKDSAIKLSQRYSTVRSVIQSIQETRLSMKNKLKPFEIVTADRKLDSLFNNFLLYQAYICRYFAKTSFYQCSGAYGFRDQLQDVLAFMYCDKAEARKHILRSAAQQFEEGDVRHWWHETTGYGIRTKISDDMMFLPFVCMEYVRYTGDISIYDEQVPFVKGQQIKEGEHSHFGKAFASENTKSLYEHCLLAIKCASKLSKQGLPLIGTGDWNDGFDRIGENGQGSSVWLAFFVYYVADKFNEVCKSRGDTASSAYINGFLKALKEGIDKSAWDSSWFLRAYYDDGTPLGCKNSEECKIDAIAQAWSAISGACDMDKVNTALNSANEYLVDEENKLIKLFTPPFDETPKDPGYIKAYKKGLRENGGQYTHGVLWLVWAYCVVGKHDEAYRLMTLLNPVEHALNFDDVQKYKVEPYVISADVYTAEGAYGMGGWTWYTGSAAWAYRIILEELLGVKVSGDKLRLNTRLPSALLPVRIEYKRRKSEIITPYTIDFMHSQRTHALLDGAECDADNIQLLDDGKRHKIVVYVGREE